MDRSREQSIASSSHRDDATTKLGQGSILPRTVLDRLDVLALKDIPDPVVVVISHDCDLVRSCKDEPYVELIPGQIKDEMKGGLANGQSPHTLHFEFVQNGKTRVLELCTLNKVTVNKTVLIDVDPDPDAVLTRKGVETLQGWLASRYKRAAFPDDLDGRMKPIKDKLRSVDKDAVRAIIGTWVRYEPEVNHLSDDVPYELWVKIVYSTEEYDAQSKAERHANKLRSSFEKNFFNRDEGVWHSIDLRACEAVADNVFSVRDLCDYKQWRLEHLSLRQDPPGEYI